MPIFKGSTNEKTQIHIAGKNYSNKTPKMTRNHCDKKIVFLKKMYCTVDSIVWHPFTSASALTSCFSRFSKSVKVF